MTTAGRWRRIAALAALFMSAVAAPDCAASRPARSLDAESREFVSKARFIITRPEKKRFLALPASERRAFIEEFWRKRDPRPDTPVNEFKDQYFQRIAEANHLFREAAEPGWLQDRGRVYILLGPPTNRITYPRGVTFYDVPREFWYYGFFVILFTDEAWNGNYKLDPLSVEQISVINRAQNEWQPQVAAEKGGLEFSVEARKTAPGRGLVKVIVPYRAVWFDVKEQKLLAKFLVTLDLLDLDGGEVRQATSEHLLETTEDELRQGYGKSGTIEIPVEAPAGDYWVRLTLENAGDGAKAYRRVRLSL